MRILDTTHVVRMSALFMFFGLLCWYALAGASTEQTTRAALEKAVAGASRSEESKARDQYRHPVETLSFFGIRDDMTVVELTPGGGWYTEILAPFLREHGLLFAANYDPKSKVDYYRKSATEFAAKLKAGPAVYDKVVVGMLETPDKLLIAPDGVADMVLTFRNLHNWMNDGHAEDVLRAAYRALKPGGIFGLVEHRGNPKVPQDPKAESGYVNQDTAIALAKGVGFELVASSEINANPKDTKDHPKGVWTLPPSFALGDKDRAKYAAIGESDRMTLKFRKPAAKAGN
jgi:predicted methyltransferase